MKTRTVLKVQDEGSHYLAIRTEDRHNPYRAYKVWYGHRKLLAKFADLCSAVGYIHELILMGN